MDQQQIYEGPLGQYVIEIALILLGAFLLGYLLRLLLNDRIKDKLSDLELENEVLKKQLNERTSRGSNDFEAKLKQSESMVKDLNDRLSQCISRRVQAENALSLAETKILELSNDSAKNSKKPDEASSVYTSTGAKVVENELSDDLKKIEGVGPKIEQLLNGGGIRTYKEVINSTPQAIKSILIAAGPTYAVHNPSTWGEQACLAAQGKWDELKKLQEELKGGKRTK